jgi:hypothetical protein
MIVNVYSGHKYEYLFIDPERRGRVTVPKDWKDAGSMDTADLPEGDDIEKTVREKGWSRVVFATPLLPPEP